MRLLKNVLMVALAFALFSSDSVLACGDKFLIVGRGSRFQRAYVALHPASLLVVNANITAQRDLQTSLKLAGHRVRVTLPDQVAGALASGRFDFILADFRDIESIGRALPHTVSNSIILPVIDGSSPRDMEAASKQYTCLLGHGRSMKAGRHFLAEIDAAMDSKLKAAPLACDVK